MTDIFQISPLSVNPYIFILALLLDAAIGDPRWLPHPVRITGRAICIVEAHLRNYFKTPRSEKFAGIILAIMIITPVFFITFFICGIAENLSGTAASFMGGAMLVYLASTTIAARELVSSAASVIQHVKAGNIKDARLCLSMIVGRDTHDLSDRGVLRAAIETLAENLSDGVIAPVFYMAVGGIPLAVAYKAVNTLDSMVGYKNGKYMNFGWASAKLDDIANYIPARITGILIVLAVFIFSLFKKPLSVAGNALTVMLRDGRKHTSPNSGFPEAAMAGALGIRVGGPSTYGGIQVKKPYIGDLKTGAGAEDYTAASENALAIVRIASLLSFGIATAILYIKG